jgi:hypothetical protein
VTWIILIVAVVVIAGVFLLMRGAGGGRFAAAPASDEAAAADAGLGFRPPASDFHVSQGEAHVYFDVPVPDGETDPVLRDILLGSAVEVLREKRSHLPLEGVSTVHAHAVREGERVEVGKLTLDGPGELPPPSPIGGPMLGTHKGPDLFEEFGSAPPEAPGLDVRTPTDDLAPIGADLRLTGMVEAGLRAQGLDPQAAQMSDLVPALLRVGGYTVTGDGARLSASKGGVSHYVEIVDHAATEHPELSEKAVNEFMVRFAGSGSQRGLLFTAKYGPFLIYDKERREPKVRFVTRERFQSFVNAISIG